MYKIEKDTLSKNINIGKKTKKITPRLNKSKK